MTLQGTDKLIVGRGDKSYQVSLSDSGLAEKEYVDAIADNIVMKTGDTMTGDLTLGDGTDDKIVLDATDGSATFAADASINSLTVGRGAGNVDSNTAVGKDALLSNTTGTHSTAVGWSALQDNTTGTQNTAFGTSALRRNTTGRDNTALGKNALYNNTEGNYNTALGKEALLSNTTGTWNTAVGQIALYRNTTGNYNTAVGKDALNGNTTGHSNVALGAQALAKNTTGEYNIAIGRIALYENTTGFENTAVGKGALYNNNTGSLNTAVGLQAGFHISGSNNTILGAYKGTSADNTLNNTVIISAGETERVRIDSNGNTEFYGKVTSTSTEASDPDTTLVTKDYVDDTVVNASGPIEEVETVWTGVGNPYVSSTQPARLDSSGNLQSPNSNFSYGTFFPWAFLKTLHPGAVGFNFNPEGASVNNRPNSTTIKVDTMGGEEGVKIYQTYSGINISSDVTHKFMGVFAPVSFDHTF